MHYWSFWSRAWDWYRVLSNCTVVLFSVAIAFSYWLLQGCAGSWIQIRPQIASNGKLQLSRGNREVNGNCNWWHAWFDCCCIAKSNRRTVYAPKDIPNRNHPPPPPTQKMYHLRCVCKLRRSPVTIIKEDQSCRTMLLFRIFNANVIWKLN